MIRTALRLGTLPLFAALTLLLGVGVPFWQWFALVLFSPFALGLTLLSYWQFKADPPQSAVPLWARKLAPYVWGFCAAVMLSVPLTSWRLHGAFRLAQPRLERLHADVQAGKPMAWPQHAGEFEILDADVERGETYFYLTREDGESPTMLIRSASPEHTSNSKVVLGENWIYSEPFD